MLTKLAKLCVLGIPQILIKGVCSTFKKAPNFSVQFINNSETLLTNLLLVTWKLRTFSVNSLKLKCYKTIVYIYLESMLHGF